MSIHVAARCLLIVVCVAGCSQEPQHWQTAAEADTEAAYETYLAEHPSGEHMPDANARLQAIRGDRAWEELAGHLSADAFGTFVRNFPKHAAIGEARFLYKIHTRAEELSADDLRIVGAEITGLGGEDRGGVAFKFDEPFDQSGLGMISTSMGLSTTADLEFEPADLVVGNRVQLYMGHIETKLPRMTVKHWAPLGFVKEPAKK